MYIIINLLSKKESSIMSYGISLHSRMFHCILQCHHVHPTHVTTMEFAVTVLISIFSYASVWVDGLDQPVILRVRFTLFMMY